MENVVGMPHCPVCGEPLSWFDRRHVRERHPRYFHDVRKWQLATSFFLISESVFLMINSLSQDWFFKWLSLTVALITMVFAFFALFKWLSVAKKYKVPWRKTLPLSGTDG